MQSEKPSHDVFLSYARKDPQFALRFAQDVREGGADLWMDLSGIKSGERWDRSIEDALASCPRLLVVLSPAAVKSTNVMDEMSYALTHKETVLPVIYRNCKIPFRLQRVQHEDLSQNYEAGVDRLLARLGVEASSPEIPEATMDQDLVGSSGHHGSAEKAAGLSQTSQRDEKATPLTPMKRALVCTIAVIASGLLIAIWLLLHWVLPSKTDEKILPIEKKITEILREVPKTTKIPRIP